MSTPWPSKKLGEPHYQVLAGIHGCLLPASPHPCSNVRVLSYDGFSGDVMGVRRKGTGSCCTARGREEVAEGKSKEHLHFSKAGCPLGTAGL